MQINYSPSLLIIIKQHNPRGNPEIIKLATFILLHIDDGAISFSLREDMILGIKICITKMAKSRLTAYARSKENSSKMKVMLIPSASTLHRQQCPFYLSNLSINKVSSILTNHMKHSPKLQDMHVNINETNTFKICNSS